MCPIGLYLADVLSELHRSQESAFNLRDAARQDYLTRAKICTKVMKYPHVEDYAVSRYTVAALYYVTHPVHSSL